MGGIATNNKGQQVSVYYHNRFNTRSWSITLYYTANGRFYMIFLLRLACHTNFSKTAICSKHYQCIKILMKLFRHQGGYIWLETIQNRRIINLIFIIILIVIFFVVMLWSHASEDASHFVRLFCMLIFLAFNIHH